MQLTGNVLIVDDEPHVRLFLGLIVQTLGPAIIHQAACGEAAITLFHSLCPKPVLVILDINMPGIDGIETLRRLRAGGATCPIVMLTSLTIRQTVEDAIAAESNAFIRKDNPKAEIAALLMEVWKAYVDQVEECPASMHPAPLCSSFDRRDEVWNSRRDSRWDHDRFGRGV